MILCRPAFFRNRQQNETHNILFAIPKNWVCPSPAESLTTEPSRLHRRGRARQGERGRVRRGYRGQPSPAEPRQAQPRGRARQGEAGHGGTAEPSQARPSPAKPSREAGCGRAGYGRVRRTRTCQRVVSCWQLPLPKKSEIILDGSSLALLLRFASEQTQLFRNCQQNVMGVILLAIPKKTFF